MIELSASSGQTVVGVVGDLDLAERSSFADIFATVAGRDAAVVVVDLCAVDFLDSAGATFLTQLAALTCQRGGSAILRGARAQDLYVLRLCGGLARFTVDASHQDCSAPHPRRPWSSPRREEISQDASR